MGNLRILYGTATLLIALSLSLIQSAEASRTYINQGQPVEIQEVDGRFAIGAYDEITASSGAAPQQVSPRISFLADDPNFTEAGDRLYVFDEADVQASAKAQAVSHNHFVYPVYQRAGGAQIYLRPELIVRLANPADLDTLAEQYQLKVLRNLQFTEDEFLLQIAQDEDPLTVSDLLWQDPRVLWSNPNFVEELMPAYRPRDSYYHQQWALNNRGRGIISGVAGGIAGEDVNAEEAWDLQEPNPEIVIAIIDSGMELRHPDLNIYSNMAEAGGTPGVDDDRNGYIDDIQGWDFLRNDNNPAPDFPISNTTSTLDDTHATSCAGIAAAIGNNRIGIAGAAFGCQILPVRVFGQGSFATLENMTRAFRYAARHADVISCSWTLTGPIPDALRGALSYARSRVSKRGTLGVPILFASGNQAQFGDRFTSLYVHRFRPGPLRLIFEYKKDSSLSEGEDKVQIEAFFFAPFASNGEIFTGFQLNVQQALLETLSSSFSTGGDAPFRIMPSDRSETGYVFESGKIGDNESSRLIFDTIVPNLGLDIGLVVDYRISSEMKTRRTGDTFYVYSEVGGETQQLNRSPGIGITETNTSPIETLNSHPLVFTIGGCNEFGRRVGYSQWGAELDFVAPTASAYGGNPIVTTSVLQQEYSQLALGYTYFSGTSASSPLAAGVIAMMLSANPHLSIQEIYDILAATSDKIGMAPYDEKGFNEFYGYGRLNMATAVKMALEALTVGVEDWDLY